MVEDSGKRSVELVSPAKLNLYLDVLEKRADGYHNIIGLFQTISLYDTISMEICKEGFFLESNVDLPEKNTIRKAYEIFREETKLEFGLKVKLEKRIPIGSGLGGGSSNAATVLKYLGKQFNVPFEKLVEMAISVGSDVPFFLYGGTAVVKGKGEIVEKLQDITGYSVDLFVPLVSSSTKEMYSLLTPDMYGKGPGNIEELHRAYLERDYEKIKKLSYNVFERIFLEKHPDVLQDLKKFGEGSILKMMTGSGSAFFALYPSNEGKYLFTGGV
ncbi:4-(cytidine 5'-diphospho)-2-C-methyl-D-erythritol kinase [Thermotoga neapolitana]|nr:4-(cytidine 5'-diphospho)-2-C-methyl-D-erythritol kinase [Thermotoga neapolitana]KFZ21517.1 4-diphosphocytidyl-2C-methyl-D-erythritol kinase [Thermotoga neapolitana LA10]MDK2785896.1 4-diphosphocytidyl-2-C-methyl-D-erythritol kinase [Thermotoga sp.]MDK2950038.1 4-diphosphocytidyl-2-C-methyl-D-erythritol kinase [Thermotoga sp.]HBF11237.1 4-(cytidine 5'-diphospho)-2-C-methyl-D-erythritol kinase [Thermotoga neapolitana]